MYFIANDPRVPEDVREQMSQWGLAKDEFTDNGNWPHQIYVREARRMIGDYVMTENELLKRRPTPESDRHGLVHDGLAQRAALHHARGLRAERRGHRRRDPRAVPDRLRLDRARSGTSARTCWCRCASRSSHIAFGSIRMEPVFMILGQSAATAAVMAIDEGVAVQDVAYDKLRERLLADGQVLEWKGGSVGERGFVDRSKLAGVVVDDTEAKLTGDWSRSTSAGRWIHTGYLHDAAAADGKHTARFEAKLPKAGRYEVRLAYSANPNRATNIPVVIHHADGETMVTVNEKRQPPIDDLFVSLGTFEFTADSPAVVEISNREADGHVIVDAVQFLPK